MKSKILILTILLSTLININLSQINDASPYCKPLYQNNFNMLKSIEISGTTLNFGAKQSINQNVDYTYYNTTTFPTLNTNSSVLFKINFYDIMDIEPKYFALWIDYNKNNTFENNEIIMQNNNTINSAIPTDVESSAQLSINIPSSLNSGTYRARLMRGTDLLDPYGNYSSSITLNPCHSDNQNGYGCTYDFNLSINKVNTSSINDIENNEDIVDFYPNPCKDIVKIKIKNDEQKIEKIKILDLTGKVLIEYSKEFDIIDLSNYKSGIYFVELFMDNKKYLIEKIIKE